uniref:Retrotransposon gag domain-containing protein n=1 Tax=Fagus sylvatica TaxID=28930 RepID=A0A2N9F828_FAGSY
MTVPPKFKAPEFEKYNGRGDPMIHLQMYCRKMAPYADNEPLLIQTFQDTLTGNAAEWYSQLKKISHWKELADTFLAQYGEYAQRWREKAARARPPLDEREMIKIFVDTLKNPYFDRMIGLQMQFFVDLIPVGERIEDALKTKKIVDMTALMALAEQAAKKAPTKKKGRRCANDREKQRKTKASPPNFHHAIDTAWAYSDSGSDSSPSPSSSPDTPDAGKAEKNLISPVVPRPYTGPQRKDYNPNSTCDFHFGEVGHTVENCNQLRHRVQDLIDHGVLKFEGLPNITTNPLLNHPKGGVNMVEIEEEGDQPNRASDSISWRRLFHTLERQRHITPLEAPPGPSTGDACEYHSGAGGHSLECCEEFKKKLNLDDIVEDEMDLDNLQDERDDWGYFMEDDTDEWRNVDFTKLFQFPCLIVPPGFETPEFEIFYENGDPEAHLQKYGEKMAFTLGERTFDDLEPFWSGTASIPIRLWNILGLKEDGEPYVIPDLGVNEVIMEIKEKSSMTSLPALTEGKEEEKAKPLPPAKDPDSTAIAEEREEPIKTPSPSNITTTTAEEEYAGPMVEGLSIHTIAEEEDSTTPPTRHCQQGEEAKMWTCVPLLQRVSRLHAKPQMIPTFSEIDNKTNCSLDNIDNSDEEIELPNDILEALERQDEGSKPNIEELEIINLADEGEEPREVKIGTRCTTEQKEALIALLREFHEIFAWSYQDMPGLDTDIVVHKIPLKPECKPREASAATNEA